MNNQQGITHKTTLQNIKSLVLLLLQRDIQENNLIKFKHLALNLFKHQMRLLNLLGQKDNMFKLPQTDQFKVKDTWSKILQKGIWVTTRKRLPLIEVKGLKLLKFQNTARSNFQPKLHLDRIWDHQSGANNIILIHLNHTREHIFQIQDLSRRMMDLKK